MAQIAEAANALMNQLSDFCEIMDPQGVMRLRRHARVRASRIHVRIRARPDPTPRRRNYVSLIPRSSTTHAQRVVHSVLSSVVSLSFYGRLSSLDPNRRYASGGVCGRVRANTRGCVRSRSNGASGPFDSSDRKDRKSFDRSVIRNACSKGATDQRRSALNC